MSNTETATSNINMEKAELLNRTFAQRFNSKQPSLGLADIPSANPDNLSDNILKRKLMSFCVHLTLRNQW